MSWAVSRVDDSGLERSPALEVKSTIETRAPRATKAEVAAAYIARRARGEKAAPLSKGGKRILTMRELGLMFWHLDATPRAALGVAVKLQMLTIQRRATVASAMRLAFEPHDEYGMCWVVLPELMKGKREHSIPLTAAARQVAERALLLPPPSPRAARTPWVFPQMRLRWKGTPGDGHVHVRSINETLYRLQAPGQPLHSDHRFGTHVFRHTFSTMMSQRHGNRFKEETKLVLHHAEGRGETVEEMHYNVDPRYPENWAVLSAWEEIVLEAADAHKPRIDSLPPAAVLQAAE